MINDIYIENFKCFAKPTHITGLKRFNLLTGKNGSGKSSLLQPLLLFNQTLMRQRTGNELLLNGDLIELGLSSDVKNIDSDNNDPIKFGFNFDDKSCIEYSLSSNADNPQILNITNIIYTKNGESKAIAVSSNTNLSNLFPEEIGRSQNRFPYVNLKYISAERTVPKLQHEASHRKDWIGPHGEFTVQVLFDNKDKIKPDDFFIGISKMFPNDNIEEIDHSIMGIAQYWLSKMFGDITIDIQFNDVANLYTLNISLRKSGLSKRFIPTNISSGFNHVLPIIVSGLTSTPGDILIIENPESLLHPSAQSIITRFLNHIASTGVQIFVETHSEHIINAIRVLANQNLLKAEDVNILFFSDEYEDYFKHIELYSNGELKDWPTDFFDQNEKDLDTILGL